MSQKKYQLYLGDCSAIIAGFDSDFRVDVTVTDPPYGIGENSKKVSSREKLARAKNYGHFDWDRERVSEEVIRAIFSLSQHQVIFGGNYYSDILPASSSWIVWDKCNGASDFADCELAWTSHKKAVRKFSYMWNGMIKQRPEERFHPTQKPLDLMVWVLENYSNHDDLIFDPFMGSGTTGVAAAITGRRFVGIEKNENYFEIASTRIKNAHNEFTLTRSEKASGQMLLLSEAAR